MTVWLCPSPTCGGDTGIKEWMLVHHPQYTARDGTVKCVSCGVGLELVHECGAAFDGECMEYLAVAGDSAAEDRCREAQRKQIQQQRDQRK